jgi:hypothetical protein
MPIKPLAAYIREAYIGLDPDARRQLSEALAAAKGYPLLAAQACRDVAQNVLKINPDAADALIACAEIFANGA